MANQNLVNELTSASLFADEQGYWKARGHEKFPGWAQLPFADFFENLSSKEGNGHKKMWLNPDGSFKEGRLSYSTDTLLPLYEGIELTQRQIVSAGYFTYSALICNLHMRLAYYSRKLGVSPDVRSVYEAADDKGKVDIANRALALRSAAYLIYEGDGLGGYSDKVWLLWGRIQGIPCPDNYSVLTATEAKECSDLWKDSTDEERKELFYEWWCDIDENHKQVGRPVINQLYTGYKLYQRYQGMESPFCPKDRKFDPKSTFDVQAAVCGFFRRSAVGLSEAKAYDPNDLSKQPNRLADMLLEAVGKFKSLLTGNDGLTPFGKYIMDLMDLNLRRIELIEEVVGRQTEDHYAQMEHLKEGRAMKVAKRGRIRRR